MTDTSAYQIQALKTQLQERQMFLQWLNSAKQATFKGSAFSCVVLNPAQASLLNKLVSEVYIP